jgi:hypothetical protein
MNEKEARRLKEILFALIYAKYLRHGTDGHNARMIMAEQATELGYAFVQFTDMFILTKDGVRVLDVRDDA